MKTAFVVAFALLTASAVGQYSHTITGGGKDATEYAKSGTNLWIPLTGKCQAKSFTVSTQGTPWCIGTDYVPYNLDDRTNQWTRHAEMGSGAFEIVAQGDTNIFSLQMSASCGLWPTGQQSYMLAHWSGSAWSNLGICASEASMGWDGVLAVVEWDTATNVSALAYSKDNGGSWTIWADNWSFIYLWTLDGGCAIHTGNNTVYEVSVDTAAVSRGAPSNAQLQGCVLFPLDDSALMVWDSNGNIFFDNDGTWHQIAGSAAQIGAGSKGAIYSDDPSGNPYHMNIFAGSLSITVTGSYANFPGMRNYSTALHTIYASGSLPHNFPGYGGGTQQIFSPATNVNVSSTAWNASCDPLIGGGECGGTTASKESCNEGGYIGGSNDNPTMGISHWFVDRNPFYNSYQDPPVFINGRWYITVHIIVSTICDSGTPTCKLHVSELIQPPDVWDLKEKVSSTNLPIVKGLASVAPYTGPWVVRSSYLNLAPPLISANTCVKLDVQFAAATPIKVCD